MIQLVIIAAMGWSFSTLPLHAHNGSSAVALPAGDIAIDVDFAATLSDEHRALLTGEQKFNWPRKHRDLGAPAETV